MSKFFICAAAGIAAACVTGFCEAFTGNFNAIFWAVVFSMSIWTTFGLLSGIFIFFILLLIPRKYDLSNITKTINSRDPHISASIAVFGLGTLLAMPFLFKINYYFMTSFANHTLAAFALLFVMYVFAISFFIVCKKTVKVTENFLLKTRKFGLLKKPLISVLINLILVAAAFSPPLLSGIDAKGPYAFIGFLRKDGLYLTPVLLIILQIVLLSFLGFLFKKLKDTSLKIVTTLLLLLAVCGLPWAAYFSQNKPQLLDHAYSFQGIVPPVMRTLKNLFDSDNDGFGLFFGAIDCNDNNSKINPMAVEIPGNNIDEDCSGQDLKRLPVKVADKKQKKLITPQFPTDVSLLLITVDTWRFNAAGFMGYERDVTPNLDKIASSGVVYERAYALGSYTGHAIPSIMTGKYAGELIRNDKHECRVSKKETFAAELICKEDVRCGAFLSHFLFKPRSGWHQGFDDWEIVKASPSGLGHIDTKYNSHTVTDGAIKWLSNKENTKGKFFLWVHYMDPHREYLSHKGYKKFGSDRRAMYDHELLYTDHQIGRLLDYFKKSKAYGKTIIMATADHGESFKEHGKWCHGWELWEEIIRVPFFITGPSIDKKRIARKTSLIDLFPTFLDIFGIEIPQNIHGRSLVADWINGQELKERAIVADQPLNGHYDARRIFIKDNWKLHHLPQNGGYRLYHLTEDYERTESLVKTHPEEFKKIKDAYEQFLSFEYKFLPTVKLEKWQAF